MENLKLISFNDSEGKNIIGTTDDEVDKNTNTVSIYKCSEDDKNCAENDINTKTNYENIKNLKIFNVGNTITFNYNDNENVNINVTSKIVKIYKTYINLNDNYSKGYTISYIENISIVNEKLKLISFDDFEGKKIIGTTDDEVEENTNSVSIYKCSEDEKNCAENDINIKTNYENIKNLKIFNVDDKITFIYKESSKDEEPSKDEEQIIIQNTKIFGIFKSYINMDDEKKDGYQISFINDIVSFDDSDKSLGGKRRTKKAAKKNKKTAKKAKKQKKSSKKTKRHR
jgi:hypothetical protein